MKALWQKLWLLFTAIWVVVAALQIFSILLFSGEPDKVLRPVLLALAVPALAYAALWLWFRWTRGKQNSGSG